MSRGFGLGRFSQSLAKRCPLEGLLEAETLSELSDEVHQENSLRGHKLNWYEQLHSQLQSKGRSSNEREVVVAFLQGRVAFHTPIHKEHEN